MHWHQKPLDKGLKPFPCKRQKKSVLGFKAWNSCLYTIGTLTSYLTFHSVCNLTYNIWRIIAIYFELLAYTRNILGI